VGEERTRKRAVANLRLLAGNIISSHKESGSALKTVLASAGKMNQAPNSTSIRS
jgi:hypothetical protein